MNIIRAKSALQSGCFGKDQAVAHSLQAFENDGRKIKQDKKKKYKRSNTQVIDQPSYRYRSVNKTNYQGSYSFGINSYTPQPTVSIALSKRNQQTQRV